MSEIEIGIRHYQKEIDDPYIYSTWTKYAWYSAKEPIHTPKHEWFQNKIKEIKEILEKGKVHIACIKQSPYVIIGYIVVLDGQIKWTCIKKDFRKEGIGKLLLESMKGLIDEQNITDQ